MHFPLKNTTISIHRYTAAHTVTDSRYIQYKILVVHVRPGDNWTTATCTAQKNTNLSIYRYIAGHTFTDSRYIQNKILVVHVRPGDNWTPATCTAHPNTNLSIYRYIAPHTVTDSRYIQIIILVDHVTPGDIKQLLHALAIQSPLYESSDISQDKQLPTVGTYRTKYWLSTSERATTELVLLALPVQTKFLTIYRYIAAHSYRQ